MTYFQFLNIINEIMNNIINKYFALGANIRLFDRTIKPIESLTIIRDRKKMIG